MNAIIEGLNANVGFVSFIFTLFVAIFVSRMVAKSKVENAAGEAQKSAIEAMVTEMGVLKGRIDDIKKENAVIKKENTRLQLIMETISAALKGMGFIVSVEGELVRIKHESGNENIVQRIHGSGWSREEDK